MKKMKEPGRDELSRLTRELQGRTRFRQQTFRMRMWIYAVRTAHRVKRLADFLLALTALILLGPLFLILALMIKSSSAGPVIFTQIRIGRGGRRFRFYKFRSMYMDSARKRRKLRDRNQSADGVIFKMKNDPRITPVGRILRRTSLDELPQLVNVLRGDMSLVGTRPPTEEEFEAYDEHYRRRLSMKPGLTGLWQVSGRNEISRFDEVVKLDLEYIDTWSIRKDAKILLQTIAVVLGGKGAS